MSPIVKVLGPKGEILHDCLEAGCEVSWDGYALRDLEGTAKGERVPGAEDPGEQWRRLDDGATVQATHAG